MKSKWVKDRVSLSGLRMVAWTILLGLWMGVGPASAQESLRRLGSAVNQQDETVGEIPLTGPAVQSPSGGPPGGAHYGGSDPGGPDPGGSDPGGPDPGGSDQELIANNTFRCTFVVSGEPQLLQAIQAFHKGRAIRARVKREVPEWNIVGQPRFLMRPLGQQSLACGVEIIWNVAERQSVSAVERQQVEERLTGIVRDMLEKEMGRLNDLLLLPQLKQASIKRERLQAEIDQISAEMDKEESLLNEQQQRSASLEMALKSAVPELQKRVLEGEVTIVERTAKLEAVVEYRNKLMSIRDKERAEEGQQWEGDAAEVFRQLQSIADLREESLRRAEGLFQEGTVSNSSLTELKIKAAESRLQLAQFAAQHRGSGRETERLDQRINELSMMAESLELELETARRSLKAHQKDLAEASVAADQFRELTRELAKREANWKRANESREELRAKLRQLEADLNQPRRETLVEVFEADLVP